MDRRTFIKSSTALAASYAAVVSTLGLARQSSAAVKGQNLLTLNPYKNVDWDKCSQHKAALHIHTMQSDGHHWVDEVVNCYRNAGYSIMSITDHDYVFPNVHVEKDVKGFIPVEKASVYPKDPKPENYPANTTWPWTDYGCSSPQNLGMIGIEGNEISYLHHLNSYYTDCGWTKDFPDRDRANWEEYELGVIAENNGLSILNHPGIPASWWKRKPLDWYVNMYQNISADSLIGIEVTNNKLDYETYDIGLWDQLLARFMPQRPIWGFGNDDMHGLRAAKQTFNIFPLAKLTDESVKEAMQNGQFVFCRSSRDIDYRRNSFSGFDIFPTIEKIDIDADKGTITIAAKDYDEIKWISAPESLEVQEDYKTSMTPWQMGKVVHTGKTLNYRTTAGIKNYVRVELHRRDGEHTQRTFTNPFGFVTI